MRKQGTLTQAEMQVMNILWSRPGMKGTYWNNMEMKGEVAATQELPSPIHLDNGGHTAFATGVGLEHYVRVLQEKGLSFPQVLM